MHLGCKHTTSNNSNNKYKGIIVVDIAPINYYGNIKYGSQIRFWKIFEKLNNFNFY